MGYIIYSCEISLSTIQIQFSLNTQYTIQFTHTLVFHYFTIMFNSCSINASKSNVVVSFYI